MTAYEMLEFEVCQQTDIPAIPDPIGPDSKVIWVQAVAKIVTRDMKPSFAIVRNNLTDKPMVIKCFSTGGIGKILSIHPYMMLDRSILPSSKELIMRDLKEYTGFTMKKLREMPDEEFDRLMYKYAIERQIVAYTKMKAEEEAIRKRQEEAARLEAMRHVEDNE